MRVRRIDRAGRVKISVLLLGRRNSLDQGIDVSVELRIGVNAQRVRRPLDHFVDVGIVERIPRRLRVLEPLTAQRPGGADEVVDAAAQLALFEGKRNRLDAVGLDARRPEHVVEVDSSEGYRLDGIVAVRGDGPPGRRRGLRPDGQRGQRCGGDSEGQDRRGGGWCKTHVSLLVVVTTWRCEPRCTIGPGA